VHEITFALWDGDVTDKEESKNDPVDSIRQSLSCPCMVLITLILCVTVVTLTTLLIIAEGLNYGAHWKAGGIVQLDGVGTFLGYLSVLGLFFSFIIWAMRLLRTVLNKALKVMEMDIELRGQELKALREQDDGRKFELNDEEFRRKK